MKQEKFKFKFKPGDVVKLNGSGQAMTVEYRLFPEEDTNKLFAERYICVWFDDLVHLREATFRVEVLRKD